MLLYCYKRKISLQRSVLSIEGDKGDRGFTGVKGERGLQGEKVSKNTIII